MFDSIIPPDIVQNHLDDPDWVIIDCGFELSDPAWGKSAYLADHIPNAYFADLNLDLSSPKQPGSGRHPLPNIAELAEKLARWGINEKKQVVVYDHLSGAFSARLWCLIRYLGHNAVAVMDGGYNGWKSENHPVTKIIPDEKSDTNFIPHLQSDFFITTSDLEQKIDNPTLLLIDARAKNRFLGLEEPIDPIAGHIPNAVNLFHQENLTIEGYFKPDQELVTIYKQLTEGDLDSKEIIVYCGSGVTSCLNLVALHKIGIQHGKLYLGSWSEWIEDPSRPIINTY